MTTWLSDDTWSQLDPSTGRLDARGRRFLAVGLVVACAVGIALVLGCTSGVLVPKLSLAGPSSTQVDAAARSLEVTMDVHNDGWFPERIVSAGAATSSMAVRVAVAQRVSIPADGSAHLSLRVRVTDCARAGATETSSDGIVLRVDRPWGTASTDLSRQNGYADEILNQEVLQSACGHAR